MANEGEGQVTGRVAERGTEVARMSDRVLGNAERLNSRLADLTTPVESLLGRVGGVHPDEEIGDASDQLRRGGFVHSVDEVLDRAHAQVARLENLVAALSEFV